MYEPLFEDDEFPVIRYIKSYENRYCITEDKRVYSENRGYCLKQYDSPQGKRVRISHHDGPRRFVLVDDLYAEAFPEKIINSKWKDR